MTASNQIPDAAELLDALAAVREALAIPHAGTVGDDEIRAKILDERTGHTVAMLTAIFDRVEAGRDPDIPWSTTYLRARLADYPATGYKTWDERMAELGIARAVEGR